MSEKLETVSKVTIPLSEPFLGGNEREYLLQCLETNYVSSIGPFVSRFEKDFTSCVGAKYSVATSSGTTALHLALRLLGVASGDEVLVSTFTFVASANVIAYVGGTPVFIDSEPRSWNLDPDLLVSEVKRRAKIGRLPKAILVVHIYGHPADLDPILEVARQYEIPVVEDAAQSLGAYYKGRHVSTFGVLGCFSFNGNKVVTTGGGGIIVTDHLELAQRAKHLSTQATLPGAEYHHDEIGYNYRLSNLQAALGVAQLEQLPSFLQKKRAVAARYHDSFKDLPGVSLIQEAPWARSSWWMYSLLIEPEEFGCDRNEVLARLREKGIQSRPVWTPLHTMPLYSNCHRVGGQVAEKLFSCGLNLPCSVGLSNLAQDLVIDSVKDCCSV